MRTICWKVTTNGPEEPKLPFGAILEVQGAALGSNHAHASNYPSPPTQMLLVSKIEDLALKTVTDTEVTWIIRGDQLELHLQSVH